MQGPRGKPHVIHSREGVIQGCPLSMHLYGIGLLPLVEKVREACEGVVVPMFADDLTLVGRAKHVCLAVLLVCKHGPNLGYFPEPAKSWCVVPGADEGRAIAAHEAPGLTVQYTRGHRYVGGFVGSAAMEDAWIKPQVKMWVEAVGKLAKVAVRYPATAYVGLVWSLQAE